MRKTEPKKKDPVGIARKLRGMITHPNLNRATGTTPIPTTLAELYARKDAGNSLLSAFEAIHMVQYDAACTPDEAQAAVESVIPELFADYWEPLWAEHQAQRDKEKGRT